MNKAVELLQYIARTAYKTQEAVKTLELYFDTSNTSDINRLYILLEAVKTNSIKSTLEIITQSEDSELRENPGMIKKLIGLSDELYISIKRSIPDSAPDNLKHTLDANMQGLKKLMVQLNAPAMNFNENEKMSSL